MAFTRIYYTGDGSTTTFTFDFPYVNESEIQVLVGGDLKVLGDDYNFTDEYTIEFETASTPADGDFIIIRRVLDFSQRPDGQSWTDTNRLPASDHNKEDNYDLWRSQENYDNRGIPRSNTRVAWDAQDDQDDETPTTIIIENAGYAERLDDVVTVRYLNDALTGTRAGLAGVFRFDPGTFGDGETTDFELIPSGEARIPQDRPDMVMVYMDGRLVPEGDYSISANGRSVVFDKPAPNGVLLDALVLTAAIATFADGSVGAGKIALTENYIIIGGADGYGDEILISDISLSRFGAPSADVPFNSKKITGLATPTAATDGANKSYVDAAVAANAPFPSVTSAIAYTLSTVIENASGATQLVNMQILISSNIGQGKEYALQYADDVGMTTNLKTAAIYRVTSLGARESNTIMALIPAGKFWRWHITDGTHSSAITFQYQIGGA